LDSSGEMYYITVKQLFSKTIISERKRIGSYVNSIYGLITTYIEDRS